jgi:methionine--tRNA ligase beta chain
MAIDPSVVRHTAGLARLPVPAAEEARYADELGKILGYVERLQRLEGVEPSAGSPVPRREDDPVDPDPSAVLAAAPSLKDGLFDVPTRSATVEKPAETLPEKPLVEMSVFQQLDLRSGLVVEAGPHPSADRLLVLKVDVGEERPRTVVAGIAGYYPDPSVLVGRTLIVVCNLVPAKLRGVTSEAMLLAAGGKEHRGLVTVREDCPPGTLVR